MYNTANSFNPTSTFDANTNTFVINPGRGTIENTPEAIAQSWMNVREFERQQRAQKFAFAAGISYDDFDAWLDMVVEDMNSRLEYGFMPFVKTNIEPSLIPAKAAKCFLLDGGHVYTDTDANIICGTPNACMTYAMAINANNTDHGFSMIKELNRSNPNYYRNEKLDSAPGRIIISSPMVKDGVHNYRKIGTGHGDVIVRYHSSETGEAKFDGIVAFNDAFEYKSVKAIFSNANITLGTPFNMPQTFYFDRGNLKCTVVDYKYDAYELSEFIDKPIGGCINENNNSIETRVPSNNGTCEKPVSSETNR